MCPLRLLRARCACCTPAAPAALLAAGPPPGRKVLCQHPGPHPRVQVAPRLSNPLMFKLTAIRCKPAIPLNPAGRGEPNVWECMCPQIHETSAQLKWGARGLSPPPTPPVPSLEDRQARPLLLARWVHVESRRRASPQHPVFLCRKKLALPNGARLVVSAGCQYDGGRAGAGTQGMPVWQGSASPCSPVAPLQHVAAANFHTGQQLAC